MSNKANAGTPQKYELVLGEEYSKIVSNKNEYHMDDNHFVLVQFAIKRTDEEIFAKGIITIAALPEGFRPRSGRPTSTAAVSFGTTGTNSQYSVIVYVSIDGKIICHIPADLNVKTIAGSICFYTD